MAAWACYNKGYDVTIISDTKSKPLVSGMTYLHKPCDIPGSISRVLQEAVLQENVPLDICAMSYSFKVYGCVNIPNSINKLSKPISQKLIWDMSYAVDYLWQIFQDKITIFTIDVNDIFSLSEKYDLVYCTIPRNIYDDSCKYSTSYLFYSKVKTNDNLVFYDISPSSPVYRFGVIYNQYFIESNSKISSTQISMDKVISCDKLHLKFPDNVVLVGRYGEWDKSVLVSDVYEKVLEDGR
jgi:hypothetical protein